MPYIILYAGLIIGLVFNIQSHADDVVYTAPFFYGQNDVSLKGAPTTPLSLVNFMNDIDSSMPTSSGFVWATDEQYFSYDFSLGYADAFALVGIGAAGVDAMDGELFSVDSISVINSVLVYPGDVVSIGGMIVFDSRAEGFPYGLNLDAFSFDPANGDLVFSIDHDALLGGTHFCADDLIRWDGAVYSLDTFGGCVGNIDALDLLDNGAILFSADRDWLYGAGVFARDNTVMELNDSGVFYRFGPTAISSSQDSADLVALDASRAINSGTVSFEFDQMVVNEDIGTFNINVVRQDGSEGEVVVHLHSFADTATVGTDYVLVDTDITFIDGAIGSQSRTVTILSDSLVEGSEFFDIKLTIASGTATLSSPNYLNIEILDAEDYIFRDGFE